MNLDPQRIAAEVGAGNAAYLAGDYGSAVSHYQAALEAGGDGADLHYNLGNALYRAGDRGRAILAWERALRLDPRDEAARSNLALVRSQLGAEVSQPPDPFWIRFGARVDPDGATALFLLAWSAACTLWLARRLVRRIEARLFAGGLVVLFSISALVFGATALAAWQVRHQGWSVVVEAGEVRHAPDPSGRLLFTAPVGLRLRADRRIGHYVHVRLGDREGWIEARRLEPIDPPSHHPSDAMAGPHPASGG